MGSESGEVVALNKEQLDFLHQCEEEFGDRFTEQDEEFQKVKDLPESLPPIIDPWYSRAPRNFDWSRTSSRGRRPYDDRDRRDRDRDWQNHRGYPHRYRDIDRRDRRDRPYQQF